jgi:branched-chain amino acid transport system substrate-binding protein
MRSHSKGLLAIALLALIAAVPVGALAAGGIKVGIVLPLTGAQAKFGEIEKRSFEMAAEEINAAGGIKGMKLELLFEDDTGKPDVGRAAVEKLISRDKVTVLTGGYSSSVTQAATAVAQQFKVPFLVTTGSADEITEKGYNYIFRINPTSSEYFDPFETLIRKVGGIKTMALLYENTQFGQSSAKDVDGAAKRAGIQVTVKEGYQAGAIDFKPILSKVKAAKPDIIYMVSYVMDAALLMAQSKELDISPKMFAGGGAGFTLPEFQQKAGAAADLVYSATLWTQDVPYKGAKQYFDKFKKKHNAETEYHGAEAYGSMYVVADALKRVKSSSPPTPNDIRDALAATDMMTAFGPVKFVSYGKKTQQNKLPHTFVVQWQKGKMETVWPEAYAKKKYIFPTPAWGQRK